MTKKNSQKKIDDFDKKILEHLQKNSAQSTAKLAQHLNLSTAAVWKRIKNLEDGSYIASEVALLSWEKLELEIEVLISLTLKEHSIEYIDQINAFAQSSENVLTCFRTMGATDFVIHAVFKDKKGYDIFYHKLAGLLCIKLVSATMVLERSKDTTALPISHL